MRQIKQTAFLGDGLRSFWRVTCAIFVFSLFLVQSQVAGAQASNDTMKIGVVMPLSGINAVFGQNSIMGIKTAADRINASNASVGGVPGKKIELVIVDSTSEPVGAAAAAERLISEQKVSALLGAFVSSLTLSIAQVAERHGIPLITHSWSDMITERGLKNVFRIGPKASEAGVALLDMALEVSKTVGQPMEKIAILYEDTAYGSTNAEGLNAHAKKLGIKVVLNEPYPAGISDVTSLIQKLKRSGADVVFPMSYLEDSVLIVRGMEREGIRQEIPIFGAAAGYIIDSFRTALGPLSDGVLSLSPGSWDLLSEKIWKDYEKTNKTWMVHEAGLYGLGLEVIVAASNAAKTTDPAALRDAISGIRYSDSLAAMIPVGTVEFDKTGQMKNFQVVLVQWQDGKPRTILPKDKATTSLIWRGKRYDLGKTQ